MLGSENPALFVVHMYETVVQHYGDSLNTAEKKRGFWQRFQRSKSAIPECIACVASYNFEETELSTLDRFLQGPPEREIYQHSNGLCNRHWSRFLAKADQEIHNFLLADQKRRMEQLEKKLRKLRHQQSYYIQERLMEEETESWKEAGALPGLSGMTCSS